MYHNLIAVEEVPPAKSFKSAHSAFQPIQATLPGRGMKHRACAAFIFDVTLTKLQLERVSDCLIWPMRMNS
jgi:hypothetical protein